MRRTTCMLLSIVLVWACGDDGGPGPSDASDAPDTADTTIDTRVDEEEEAVWDPPLPAEDWDRDILSTGLVIDLESLEGTATIALAASASTAASFEAQGLTVTDVSAAGGPLNWEVVGGRLDVGVPADDPVFVVEYGFTLHPGSGYDGWLDTGVTFIWPYFCGNLFPCRSEPEEGLTFTLELVNVPTGETAVFPGSIPSDAPSYQIAWASGAYTYSSLGTTPAGTEVGVWYLPGGDGAALTGTASLVDAFDWFEQTLGPYPFGDSVGSVAASWGPGAYGGMEHHPYWHVSTAAMADETVHVHEAAHGWYGGGIRILCWEDFVLSEGTVTYLTARGIGAANGPAAEAAVWASYESSLVAIVAGADGIAWPDSCGEVDILLDGLYSSVPYIKGAYFYRNVATEVGVDTLDGVLSLFFTMYEGQAAGMQDMLDLILAETSFDPTLLAEGWLRSLGRPDV